VFLSVLSSRQSSLTQRSMRVHRAKFIHAYRGKGLTVEPLGPGHIFRAQRRVKDGNKTVLTTYPEKDGGSEEPDEGKPHVRFCESS